MILGTKLVPTHQTKINTLIANPTTPTGGPSLNPPLELRLPELTSDPPCSAWLGRQPNYKNNTGPWGEAPRMTKSPKLGERWKRPGLCIKVPFPEKKTFSHLKMDGWKTTFLLGRPIFRGELLGLGDVGILFHLCIVKWSQVVNHRNKKTVRTAIRRDSHRSRLQST